MPKLSAGNDKRDWPKFGLKEIDKACKDCRLIWDVDWLANRNAALVSTIASFGNRAGEVTGLRIKDVRVDGELLYILFKIEKTRREEDDPFLTTKTRLLSYPLAKYIVKWYDYAYDHAPSTDSFLFPPSMGLFGEGDVPDWSQPVNRRVAWNVVKRIAPAWWTHLFRHMLASRLAESGKDVIDLMEWFNWKTPDIATGYAQLAGTKKVREIGRGKI